MKNSLKTMKSRGVRLVPALWLMCMWIVAFAASFDLDEDGPVDQHMMMEAIHNDVMGANVLKNYMDSEEEVDTEVCYEKVGCFNESFVGVTPSSPEKIGVYYSFNTRNKQANLSWDATDDEIQSTLGDMFVGRTRLVLQAHGFAASTKKRWNKALTAALFGVYPDQNVVVMLIDWSKGARLPFYNKASANVQLVARLTMKWVTKLQELFPGSILAEDIHFIGFSLGAQMSGYFARDYLRETNTKIGRITALDPAAPLFEDYGILPRKGEADFVEGVHTSAGGNYLMGQVGVQQAFGDVDYYPNGGAIQPGCNVLMVACNHRRAYLYYISALENQACKMTGPECSTVNEAKVGKCIKSATVPTFLGQLQKLIHSITTSNSSIIFIKTNSAAPFCITTR